MWLRRTPSSVVRTAHARARISSLSFSWSAAEVSERSARAWPMVSRPALRSSWMTAGSLRRRRQVAIELWSFPTRRELEEAQAVGDRAPFRPRAPSRLLPTPPNHDQPALLSCPYPHGVEIFAE